MAAQLAYAVISIGLAYLASLLIPKKKAAFDDKPTVVATRGSFIPVLKGKRRIGLIFGYAGNRVKRRVKQGKKKWYRTREKVDTYFEDGWHILCCGPAESLSEVEQNGEPIFQGVLTRDSHPSGSTIPLGEEGSFKIYWGEIDQPEDADLMAATGVPSVWPGICYIFWKQKNLGGAAQWQNMTYVLETHPQSTILTESDGVTVSGSETILEVPIWGIWQQNSSFPGAQVPTLTAFFIVPAADIVNVQNQGLGFLNTYPTGILNRMTARVEGNTGIGMDFSGIIAGGGMTAAGLPTARTLADEIAAEGPRGYKTEGRWDFSYDGLAPLDEEVCYIEFAQGSDSLLRHDWTGTTLTADGNIDIIDNSEAAGWNPAHMIAELLFEQWPHGIGEDQSLYDMDSLEECGVLWSGANEDIRASVICQEGVDLRGVMAGLMQDLGVFLSVNMETGLLTFVPIREPEGELDFVPEDAILTEPETEVQHGPRVADRLVFTFPDASIAYRDQTISVDDDGQANRQDFFQARSVQIISTVNFQSAARIAERRAAEEMAGVYENKIELGRAARALLPGQPIIVEGLDDTQRVIATEHDVESGRVNVTLWNDFYGVPPSEFEATMPVPTTTQTPTDVDFFAGILEVPEQLLTEEQTAIVPLMIRSGTTVTSHMIYLSDDGMTFAEADQDVGIMTGGITSGFPNDLYYQEDGPVFEAAGFDIGTVVDLTSDEEAWLRGEQLAVFLDTDGTQEIAFVRNIESVGGGFYQLKGVIRARYDTQLLTLSEGTRMFIFQDEDANLLVDDNIDAEETLYMKAQPIGTSIVPLDAVESVQAPIYGKGVRPVPVREIFLDQDQDEDGAGDTNRGRDYYIATGAAPADDIAILWDYSTPQTEGSGAGEFPAGQVSYDPLPEGDFLVEILDSMDDVIRTTTVSEPTYTYTRADRLVDFVTEPALFKVRVTQIRGASVSDSTTQTITNAT